jgi:hypothetical protein
MPLLHFVGVSPLKKPFSVAYAFLKGETTECYTWALEAFKEFLGGRHLSLVVTDREQALINALDVVFPSVNHLLCRWHINNNINSNCKKHFATEQLWIDFIGKLYGCFEKATIEDFERAWTSLDCPVVVKNYLDSTIWPVKDKFARPWTNQILHFGNITTSLAEGSHSFIKKYIFSSQSNLLVVWDQLNLGLDGMDIEMRSQISRERVTIRREFNIRFLEPVNKKIATTALRIVNEERRKMLAGLENAPPCTRTLITSMGIPCAHFLSQLQDSSLSPNHFHSHWHLRLQGIDDEDADGDSSQPDTVLEPVVQSRHRGVRRETRLPLSSTRREPSQFEIVQRQSRARRPPQCSSCGETGHNARTCPSRALNG